MIQTNITNTPLLAAHVSEWLGRQKRKGYEGAANRNVMVVTKMRFGSQSSLAMASR
jgi:hypothetical protein